MKLRIILPLIGALPFILVFSLFGHGDEEHGEEGDEDRSGFFYRDSHRFPKVTHETYLYECGECHLAFPPQTLPEASWAKMMETGQLLDHFGEELEYEEETQKEILDFLNENSADKAQTKLAERFMRSLSRSPVLLRITETPFFERKHDELEKEMIEQEDVKSLANCAACHKKAEDGNFEEDSVEIPNYPNWDD